MTRFKRTTEVPRKQDAKSRAKRPKKRFLQVDVWQTTFGPVSEKAIYDIFSQKLNVQPYNLKKYTFSHCLETLRKLEDPEYVKRSELE